MKKLTLKALFSQYGFIEISDIVYFLSVYCCATVHHRDLQLIRYRLGICLNNHDNGSDYFQTLRTLYTVLYLKS